MLPKKFYQGSSLQIAQKLLGCFLVRDLSGAEKKRKAPNVIKCMIVETEAYSGRSDLASHASRGQTARNRVMFGPAGYIYVYFTYGMHHMLNIVTDKNNHPSAVLIRALAPPETRAYPKSGSFIPPKRGVQSGLENRRSFSGPGRLTKTLRIDGSFNGLPIFTEKYGLWVEKGPCKIKPSQITRSKRVGVDYAGKYKDKLWRYYLKDSPFVSKK